VYFGGADNKNVTQRAIVALMNEVEDSTKIDVVVDPGHQFLKEIKSSLRGLSNAELYIGAPSLCPMMVEADLAVGAAGTTSWERCAVGLPALVISIADNQRDVAKELHAGGFVTWLGHEDHVSADCIQESIRRLKGAESLETWSRHCWSLVDGRGLERVGFCLSANPQAEFRARSIKKSDEALILRWANDPVVRRNAFCTQLISEDEHREWFHTILKSHRGARFYIVEGSAEVPVGQVRFDRVEVGWEVTYSIDQVFRSRGLGSTVLETAISRFRLEEDRAVIIGKVRKNNAASMRVFEGLGFLKFDHADQFVTYSLE